MLLIKRYPNRKLYDTGAKRYISLDDVATLVGGGVEVTIRDAASGEDLTGLTMAQIVMERERAGRGLLPRDLLFGLVRAGEDALRTARSLIPMATGFREVVDEEIGRRLARLAERGVVSEEEASRILVLLLQPQRDNAYAEPVEPTSLSGLFDALGIATRDDLAGVATRIEQLATQIDALADERRA